MAILFLVLGLVLLTVGAELLIRGAVSLAAAARISPLVIGLTVVAFGTSAPEMVVSVQAAFRGQTEIALGNVVGSNILNVLLILGVSACIVPLVVSRQLVWFEVPIMIALSLLLCGLALDGRIGRWDGALLVAGLLLYVGWSIVQGRREGAVPAIEVPSVRPRRSPGHLLLQGALVVAGLGLLVLGSRWFTDAAAGIARLWGVSELVIGLTVVAAGTSLPEVATSIMAAIRGQRDIAVGNVVGSNIMNILAVMGLASVVAPRGVIVAPAALTFDMPVMTAAAVACLPVFFTGHLIARWEGALFLGYYVAYTAYLVLSATQAAAAPTLAAAMWTFVFPLTIVTLSIAVWRSWRGRARGGGGSE
jgi:cation:H+ antiporter